MKEFRLSLDQEEINCLRETWTQVKQNSRGFTVQFYMALLRRYPELEDYFKAGFHSQSAALADMLELIMESADRPAALAGRMSSLAEVHGWHRVSHQDYFKFGELLRDQLLAYVPEEDRPKVGSAFDRMYFQLAEYMEGGSSAGAS